VGDAAVDDHLPRIRVGRLVEDLGRLRAHRDRRPQLEQRAQFRVLALELLGALGALGLQRELAPGRLLAGDRVRQATDVGARVADRLDRHQQRALQRVEHRRDAGADRLGDREARVGDHQEHRERGAERELRQRRRALAKEGRRRAIEGAERHRRGPSGVTRK
jgi:hypothetical protein